MTIIRPNHHWVCPHCNVEDVTHEARPHTRFHICAGLQGLNAPMVPAGSRVKVTAVEREDYIGSDDVQTDAAGRPIMSIVTEREDGSNDVAVFAPIATGRVNEE